MSMKDESIQHPNDDGDIANKKNNVHCTSEEFENYKKFALTLPSLTLTQRQRCDLELILNQGFAPLSGYLGRADYDNVLENARLSNGSLWPMPITLDISEQLAKRLQFGDRLLLRDEEGLMLAVLQVTELWEMTTELKAKEANAIFGTQDLTHPGVFYLQHHTNNFYLSGTITKISLPQHYDFTHLRHTPAQLSQIFKQLGWDKIVAFQTRNPMHRAHQELSQRAAELTGAKILIHPVTGMTKIGDIDYYTRVRCYEQILKTYPENAVFLSLLPLAMRMAGPREALWHALIRKNYGCTHFIVGRDHAGPGKDSRGEDFYPPYAAQELVLEYQKEIGLEILPFQEIAYSKKQSRYFPLDQFPKDDQPSTISGTQLRYSLQNNLDIPDWFSYPEVLQILRQAYPPKHQRGLTLLFTGLPSSGKSTLANGLALRLRELKDCQVTLLDGDVVRTHLSKGLGFTREDRQTNIQRVAFVAQEIAKHKGLVICALVAPHADARSQFRKTVMSTGEYIEVYVSTPLNVCVTRDRKGMYEQAKANMSSQFTGISDPYDVPINPEVTLDTSSMEPQVAIEVLVKYLINEGYIQSQLTLQNSQACSKQGRVNHA